MSEASKELTLDARHHRMLESLEVQTSRIRDYKDEYEQLDQSRLFWMNRIHSMVSSNTQDQEEHQNRYQEAWTSNIALKDRLQVLKKAILKLETMEDEINYYEHTGQILFDYYDLLNKQQDIDDNDILHASTVEKAPAQKGRNRNMPAPSRSILEALQGLPVAIAPPLVCLTDTNSSNVAPNLNDQVTHQPTSSTQKGGEVGRRDKRSLVEQYMSITDPSFIRSQFNEVSIGQCHECMIPLTCLMQDGIMLCQECGYQELLLVEQNKPIYRQPSKEASHFSYKRINHFNEWISQIQGKESTDIPEDIFEKIVSEIKKEKIHDCSKLSYHKMREILKKLKINKYYEHIHYIISRINGQPTPNFAPDLEEKLRTMFKEIQGPFLKHCPRDRKNFLSYSYVLYKFFQLLEKDEYLKHFPLLKSREKLHLQDQIWKKICEELNWQFIESIWYTRPLALHSELH